MPAARGPTTANSTARACAGTKLRPNREANRARRIIDIPISLSGLMKVWNSNEAQSNYQTRCRQGLDDPAVLHMDDAIGLGRELVIVRHDDERRTADFVQFTHEAE